MSLILENNFTSSIHEKLKIMIFIQLKRVLQNKTIKLLIKTNTITYLGIFFYENRIIEWKHYFYIW